MEIFTLLVVVIVSMIAGWMIGCSRGVDDMVKFAIHVVYDDSKDSAEELQNEEE